MTRALSEQKVLKKLGIPDFRHMTKEKVMSFASMLQDMEPEVAQKALEQFPEFTRTALEALQDYKGIIEKAQDTASASSKQCLDLYQEVIQALKVCLKEELPFEEKKYYIEKMMEVAKMAEAKDTEGKHFNWGLVGAGALVVITAISMGASLLGGKSDFHLPSKKL